MTTPDAPEKKYFTDQLSGLLKGRGGQVLKIRESALSEFFSMPLFESKEVKFNEDLKTMETSAFSESFNASEEGFQPLVEVHKVEELNGALEGFGEGPLKTQTGFGAFCLAFFKKGVSIVCRESRDKAFMRVESGGSLSLEPVFIRVPEGVSAELFLSFDQKQECVSFNLIRIKVEEKASLKIFFLFKGGSGRRFVDLSIDVANSGKAEVFTLRRESLDFVYRSGIMLTGENAAIVEKSLAFLKEKEKADFKSVVIEEAPGAAADIQVKTIIRDESKVGLNGMIKVNKPAVKSRSRYSGHCLKLSSSSRANVQPNLEIEALDIEASHAASVSPLDEEKLFYLEARGMSREEAEREISLGFLSALLKDHAELGPLVESFF
jgi:hypothetical protein